MKLYIFGNGFDKAHSMPTGYNDFRKWLIDTYHVNIKEDEEYDFNLPSYETNYRHLESFDEAKFSDFFVHLIDEVDDQIDEWSLWRDFEEELGKLHWEHALDHVEKVYDDDNGIDIAKTSDNYTIQAQNCGESNHILGSLFNEWIREINKKLQDGKYLPNPFFKHLDNSSLFLNFNYTSTLETLYHIDNVCHIHGNIANGEEAIIGCSFIQHKYDFDEKNDYYKGDSYAILRRILESYIKDTKERIEKKSTFFQRINIVDEIYLFGLSLGEVDAPYFEMIFSTCKNVKKVYLNSHKPDERDEQVRFLTSHGCKNEIICPWG